MARLEDDPHAALSALGQHKVRADDESPRLPLDEGRRLVVGQMFGSHQRRSQAGYVVGRLDGRPIEALGVEQLELEDRAPEFREADRSDVRRRYREDGLLPRA